MPGILNIDFCTIMPEIFITALALAILVIDLFLGRRNRDVLGYLSIIGLLVLVPVTLMSVGTTASFGGTVISDAFSAFFTVVFIIAALITLLISTDYLRRMKVNRGEYYYMVLFATLGMMVMAKSNDLVNFYVGLELMALSFYILVAFRTGNSRSVEGALKYFILGALSSGVMLYGISFVYGFAGTTNLAGIAGRHSAGPGGGALLVLGVALVVAGFSFKLALFPFHVWAPDTYEGAPTPITAFLSVGSKAAAFAVFLRVFAVAFPAFHPEWSRLLWILAALTMVYGSVTAISQKNIIRMLAYSSIAHAGIVLMGLLSYNSTGMSSILYYMLVYAFMNMGAFAVVALFVRSDGSGERIDDYRGLYSRRPALAALMTLFLLSLAGVPPTGGFAAKFFVLASAVEAGYYWLAAIGVIATAIALYFYLKVVFYMYMREPDAELDLPRTSIPYKVVLFVTAAGTVILGIYPGPFIELAAAAVKPFLS